MSNTNDATKATNDGQNDAYYGKAAAPPTNVDNTVHQNYVNAWAAEQKRLEERRRQQG